MQCQRRALRRRALVHGGVERGVRSRTLVETRTGLDRRQLAMTTAARHGHCNQQPSPLHDLQRHRNSLQIAMFDFHDTISCPQEK